MPAYRDAIYRTLSSVFGDIPEFDPAHDLADREWTERFVPYALALSQYFRPTYHGLEHIPRQGAALMVGNHSLFVMDGFFLGAAILKERGRLLRGLGEDALFMVPGSRGFWSRVGAVHGTQQNALRFLRAGHLMNTYPGGAKDALKKRSRLYQLHWGHSFGFVKVALRAQVPILFHMAVGPDDAYRIIGRVKWTGRVMGSDKYQVPILWGWGPFPRPVKFTFHIAPPIHLEEGPEAANDPETVRRIHGELWERAQAMLDEVVQQRRSIWRG